MVGEECCGNDSLHDYVYQCVCANSRQAFTVLIFDDAD